MFRFNQTIIREPTVRASLKLQYWRQLKYFVIELFGHVAALCTVHDTHTNRTGLICSHMTEQFYNKEF